MKKLFLKIAQFDMRELANVEKGSRGYVIVEAAIFMPIFLFAVVFLVYIIQMLHFQEIVHFEASKGLVRLASPSVSEEIGQGLIGMLPVEIDGDEGEFAEGFLYRVGLNRNVGEKIDKKIKIAADLEIENDVYLAEVTYPIEVNLPMGMDDDITIKEFLAARKWSGVDNSGNTTGFSFMESDDDGEYVFIFPRYGERYHKGDCKYLFMDGGRLIRCVQIGEAQSGNYSRCQVCY